MPDWPHAPLHRLNEQGTYMVTAGTYGKLHHFHTDARRRLLHDALLETAAEFGWHLQAWAVLANHYHFVAISPDNPENLRTMLGKLHMTTAKAVNQMDGAPERKVWFQFRDTQLTYERSYLARLNYVHQNPVKHGLVRAAEEYPFCSAAWFQRTASRAFQRTVGSFGWKRLQVEDDF